MTTTLTPLVPAGTPEADVLPSRHLNALVERHVFGRIVRAKKLRDGFIGFDTIDAEHGTAKPVPPYSTEVGAAWKIVERISVKNANGEEAARIFRNHFDSTILVTDGRSLAWRICVAALAALDVPEVDQFVSQAP